MTRLLILPAIFVLATLLLWLMICNAPDWESSDSSQIYIPTQFENFTIVAEQFRTYKQNHYIYITLLFIFTYLYKQTFAIPGSFVLNIIAGAVFGMWTGFLMCCALTTCGSSLCYMFSELFSREYVLYYFGERITYLQQKQVKLQIVIAFVPFLTELRWKYVKIFDYLLGFPTFVSSVVNFHDNIIFAQKILMVDDNSHRLLPFLLFARMFPISPSWLLNIIAPFLNIPLPIFAFSALIGLAPYNFICVQAGYILSDLQSWEDVFSTSTMFKLCSFALLPLAYAMFMRHPSRTQVSNSEPSRSCVPFWFSSITTSESKTNLIDGEEDIMSPKKPTDLIV